MTIRDTSTLEQNFSSEQNLEERAPYPSNILSIYLQLIQIHPDRRIKIVYHDKILEQISLLNLSSQLSILERVLAVETEKEVAKKIAENIVYNNQLDIKQMIDLLNMAFLNSWHSISVFILNSISHERVFINLDDFSSLLKSLIIAKFSEKHKEKILALLCDFSITELDFLYSKLYILKISLVSNYEKLSVLLVKELKENYLEKPVAVSEMFLNKLLILTAESKISDESKYYIDWWLRACFSRPPIQEHKEYSQTYIDDTLNIVDETARYTGGCSAYVPKKKNRLEFHPYNPEKQISHPNSLFNSNKRLREENDQSAKPAKKQCIMGAPAFS